ncbi:gpap-1 [Pristionchus pacificus]|nr:gpap-1 [Pristionchus pacificus]
MQIQLHYKNVFKLVIFLGFVYLAYLIFFSSSNDVMPIIDVELRDVVSYAVLAVEMGGHAVAAIHKANKLAIQQKGLTDEGKAELLTKADLVSNKLILDVLRRFMGLKIVSEEHESESVTDEEAEAYREDRYSLWQSIRGSIDVLPSRKVRLEDLQVFVDPLDATQEFTEGLTEYVTVMVCITQGDDPIFGAIYRPFHNETIFGVANWGVMTSSGKKIKPPKDGEAPPTIVVSRSHAGEVKTLAEKAFGSGYSVESAGGSGYKTLRLVNATAELYIHETAIKKWDTCAGDAIVRALGGAMLDMDGSPLKYGPSTSVVNKRGLVVSARNPYTYYQKLRSFLPEAN